MNQPKYPKPQSNSALCSWSEPETKESFQIMLALTIEASPSRKQRAMQSEFSYYVNKVTSYEFSCDGAKSPYLRR
jgi:hypothetical protein